MKCFCFCLGVPQAQSVNFLKADVFFRCAPVVKKDNQIQIEKEIKQSDKYLSKTSENSIKLCPLLMAISCFTVRVKLRLKNNRSLL